MAKKEVNNMTFEETLAELDKIVANLESGDLPLNEALKAFEQGVHLTRQGQKTLNEAQQRVEILLANDHNASLSPFDTIDDD